MSRRLITIAAVLLGCSATIAGAGHPRPNAASPPQDKPGPIRVSVDVVAVDVQVIDREGRPVPELTPDKFTVSINGKRRRVISAERIASDDGGDVDRVPASGPAAMVQGRVILLAIDCGSFEATASRDVIQSLRRFVGQLSPDDYLGVSAYPNGAKIDPTRDHSAVLRALETVVGQRDLADLSQFHVRPSEMIDLTRELYASGGGPRFEAILTRECGLPAEPTCRQRLILDVNTTALYYEGQAAASLGMLRSMISGMSGFTGRKTVLLVSGGMIASDTPGGRPDLGDLGILVGKEAAVANTAIYTLFIDSSVSDRFSAQVRMRDSSLDNWNRDTALVARWLEQFTGAAGGALFRVQTSNADQVLARVRNELASYYLLGVEPGDEERDGRTHEISVKTTQPNVTIRGRRWVTIPIRGAAPPSRRTPEKTADTTAATLPPASPATAPRRVVPPDVQAIADLYARGQYDSMQKSLAQTSNLANLIRGFRMADSPWPDEPKRTAIFALDLAFAGLRSDNGYARDEGARLLGEYHLRVRQPGNADAFECWWFLTEAAALQGLFLPDNAVVFIPAAIQRCPTASRLHLAYAFVSEQQWLRNKLTPAQEAEIITRYETAMKFPDTEVEARVRAARFLYATGNYDRALALLNPRVMQTTDKELRYFAELIRGQVLRASGRPDEAIAAFRSAVAAWPGAQSARVALMTLLVNRGHREEAATLAEASQTGAVDEFDPWWIYWLGDFRAYPAIVEKLRALAR
jgi:VWFA-related protein